VGWVEEKYLNLKMAIALKGFLEQNGAKVFLTRDSDNYITLADRVALAATRHADLFICVHNNATDSPTAMQGSLILYNDIQYMPLYRLTHRGIAARTGVPGLGPIEDERGLYILRHCSVPVLFVEAAFMTNSIDYARLTDSSGAYMKNIMLGVMDGILAYYQRRDLPPVVYPQNGSGDQTDIFKLNGSSSSGNDDSGSAWDPPSVTTGDDDKASNDKKSSDDEKAGSSSGTDEKPAEKPAEKDFNAKRGRGHRRH
jgi:hypothetical protein